MVVIEYRDVIIGAFRTLASFDGVRIVEIFRAWNLKRMPPWNILFPSMETTIGPDSRFAELDEFLSSRRRYSPRDEAKGFRHLFNWLSGAGEIGYGRLQLIVRCGSSPECPAEERCLSWLSNTVEWGFRAGFYTLGSAANYVLSYNSALLSISNSIINTYWRGREKPA